MKRLRRWLKNFLAMFRISFNHKHTKELLMNIADNVVSLQAAVAALDAKVSAIAAPTVDLTPALDAVAGVKSDTAAILADLTPTAA